MDLQLDSDKCILQSKTTHSFGPTAHGKQVIRKTLSRDNKSILEVSFKKKPQVIIVENWKEYNEDVSNLDNFQ